MSPEVDPQNGFLSRLFKPETLTAILLPQDRWHPYPQAHVRQAWLAFSNETRQAYVQTGLELLSQPWPYLSAELYLTFAREGDRSRYEALYFQRRNILAHLVLAECMEGSGRFLDAITSALWSICEESSWCIPAHISHQKAGVGLPDTTDPYVDLFAAETSALLAWTGYLLGQELEAISSLILPRLEREITNRILVPNLAHADFWWMGFTSAPVNNWNPWINSNWLVSVLLVEKDPAMRLKAVGKILRSLDRFIVSYPRDGGCDEGPSYWGRAGGSLYDCLDVLHSATDGELDVFSEPKIKEIGRFIYRAHIADDYYVNFADAPAIVTPDADVVFGYGRRIQDESLESFGAWIASRTQLIDQSFAGMHFWAEDIGRVLRSLFSMTAIRASSGIAPLERDVWLSEIQVMAARDHPHTSAGFFLATKGGHNAESHNHNDVGHFIVYLDGRPLIVDVGVETYSRKTFSDQRYEIWTMQSAYHSLPTIDGVMQAPGKAFCARDITYHADDQEALFTLDIAGAYPPQARLVSLMRTLRLRRSQEFELRDEFTFEAAPGELFWSFMTPGEPQRNHPDRVILSERHLPGGRKTARGEIRFDPNEVSFDAERILIQDEHLQEAWGDQLYRLVFKIIRPQKHGNFEISIIKP